MYAWSVGMFIDKDRILIVGDFNLDQMLPENIAKIDPLIQNFNLSQCSTHIHGGLLDLAFDTSNFNDVSPLQSPCNGHFVLVFHM